ncbi:hypothetical protein Pmani_037571, partial [Petrolisthes manimaculis]
CWDTCELLATNFPIWSLTCGQQDKCRSGCNAACDFFSSHPQTRVPLSQHNSRLTLVFSGTSAHWTLAWGRAAPREHVVYAVFRRGSNQTWRLLLQTAAPSASLAALVPGDEMKLVAVAESGVLSVIITPYAPPPHHHHSHHHPKAALPVPRTHSTHDERLQTNGIDVGADGGGDGGSGWALRHETEVEASGLVAARVWWPPVDPRGADYLVTWEVAGGGLKGHLYTDLAEVDLTLWPDTVYQVQVEAVSGPLGRPLRSAHLTLDTHNITLSANRITPDSPHHPHHHPHLPLDTHNVTLPHNRNPDTQNASHDTQNASHDTQNASHDTHRRQNQITPTLPHKAVPHKATKPIITMEVMAGIASGIVAALLVASVLIWRHARQSSNSTTSSNTSLNTTSSSTTTSVFPRGATDGILDAWSRTLRLKEDKTDDVDDVIKETEASSSVCSPITPVHHHHHHHPHTHPHHHYQHQLLLTPTFTLPKPPTTTTTTRQIHSNANLYTVVPSPPCPYMSNI